MIGFNLGVSPVSGIYNGAVPLWQWPAELAFGPTDKGLLLAASRLDLLSQDAAGTIPVTGPGQPVGLVRRAAGTVDAAQAVSASRPTLGRHPKTGIRNRATGAQAVDGSVGNWAASVTRNGVTATRVGSGVEDGVPYVDYRFAGTATSGVLNDLFYGSVPTYPSAVGDRWTIRATARVIAGALPAGSTLRTRLSYYVGETWTAGPTSPYFADLSVDRELLLTHTHDNASVNGVRPSLSFGGGAAGSVVDVTIRIKGLQMEAGAIATPLQHNLGANNVTEAGVPDVWYLGTDGIDDFLSTAAINWGTDEVTVIAAIHKASDAAEGSMASFGDFSAGSGGWRFAAPGSAGQSNFSVFSGAGVNRTLVSAGDAAPVTAVVTLQAKTQAPLLRLRRNGMQVAESLGSQGAVPTYFNGAQAQLKIGDWFGAHRFNGRLYGLLVINRLLTPAELIMAERWMANKCGVTLP